MSVMKRIKQIAAAFLCCLFIPCAIASDDDVDQRTISIEHLLLQPMDEMVATLESMGLVVPVGYQGEENAEILQKTVWLCLNAKRKGNMAVLQASYTELQKLEWRLVKVIVERDPDMASAWRQHYAAFGKTPPKIYNKGNAVTIVEEDISHTLE